MRNLSFILILFLLSCKSDTKNQYFELISDNDIKLSKPIEGEWLYSHKEKGQNFKDFVNAKPIKPTASKNHIYLKPIGKFTELQKQQIELVKEYLEIFFQLKVKILDDISNDLVPKNARRIGYENNEQLLASYVLDSVLIKRKPKDAIVMMGLAELDLYPKPEWNYVFGLASYADKVGISSIYRLQDTELTQANFNLCLTRLLKICSHEIGHMFDLHHCINANCVMNGTNNISETDNNFSRLCSNCQQKLNYSIKYNNRKRLVELIEYFKKNKLNEELVILQKDLREID
ncbi:archaemetzincin [Flavobacterium sp. 103]|uniref:archaemetzincin n=1 Tax=Flavobacterium sp. 103 TaxID=2135624 RepID=UPI000D5E256E|nr:archaemetzincin [Flavobacterium sp. 103]PVX47724.1 archaemetzincin [Flavobacterium sp. 103]